MESSNPHTRKPMPRDPLSRWVFLLLYLLLAVGLLAGALVPITLSGCTAPPRGIPLAYVAVGGGNHVRVIDLDAGTTLRRLYTGAGPWRLVPFPDGRRLWIQHWYAGLTTVLDLEEHEVVATLPLRGPGTFSAEGEAFLSFHWPDGKLHTVDPETFEQVEEKPTEVRQVYDLIPARNGEALYLAQYDPMGRGRTPRYGYVVVYPYKKEAEKAVPTSLSTGVSPVGLAAVPGQPFFVSIDSGTNGLSLINEQHDGRALAVCPAPRDVAFFTRDSGEVTRMAVICWRGDGDPESDVVVFDTDFTARPWPELRKAAETELPAGLSAVAFAPGGERLWVTDRTGGRLIELVVPSGAGDAPGELEIGREIETGAVPLDLVIRTVTPEERDRIAAGKTRGRRLAERTLARLIDAGEPFTGLSWNEVVVPRTDEEAAEETPEEPDDTRAETPPLHWSLRPPDGLRVDHDSGFRLARDGHSLTVDDRGRFWVAPRQELLAVVYALPALTLDEAVRRLAGDVDDSPWLSGGLALDLATEIEEKDGSHSVLIGADRPGLRVAQLWVDADSDRPTGLLEQLPSFEAPGTDFHGGAPAVEMVETQFLGFTRVDERVWMPTEIERWVEGRRGPLVQLEGFELTPDGEADGEADGEDPRFDLARLGGAAPGAGLFTTGQGTESSGGDGASSGPGRPVPVLPVGSEKAGSALPGPMPPQVAYPSSPPASGPYLPFAADWGVHEVPVPLPLQVHNLLDGGVALQWSCPRGCPDLVEDLEAYARENEQVLVAPYPWLDTDGEEGPRLALTAWGRIELLDDFDRDRIDAFVEAWGGKDHHSDHDVTP
jgi:hypothetical protein